MNDKILVLINSIRRDSVCLPVGTIYEFPAKFSETGINNNDVNPKREASLHA
jgi:hypothetical protein